MNVANVLDHARNIRRASFLPELSETHGQYRLRFARSPADLDSIYALRFDVFNLELGEGLEESYETRRDNDPFDEQCHHLMVVDSKSGRTVGTYRLQVLEMARAGRGFYTDSEFDLSALPEEVLGGAVETGRACIDKDHRNKIVLFLLWRGLTSYMLWNGRRYIFGVSSLTSQEPLDGIALQVKLEAEGFIHPAYWTPARPGYDCLADREPTHDEVTAIKTPKLFGTYLRYGAKVCGPPVIDRFFGTIDYLTLLDIVGLHPRTFRLFAHGLDGYGQ